MIYAINRAQIFLTYKALKPLFLTLVQRHVQYGAIAWGNSTNNNQILLLQKRAIRVINNKPYRAHTDPLFKSNKLLKINDIYKLQTSLFMNEYTHDIHKLPQSIEQFFPSNQNTITRQKYDIPRTKSRTIFSDKLIKHSLPSTWNNLDNKHKEITNIRTFKKIITTHLLESYLTNVRCNNTACIECNPNIIN